MPHRCLGHKISSSDRKMNTFMFAYAALLFIVLTPGVLLRLPMNGSKMTVALTHGLVFAVVWHFTHKMVWRASYEGFQAVPVIGGVGTPPVVMARAAVVAAQKDVDEARENLTQAQRAQQLANQGHLRATQALKSSRTALEAAQRSLQLATQADMRKKETNMRGGGSRSGSGSR